MIVGILFVVFGYVLNRFLRKDKPNPEKLSTYECGEEAIGPGIIPFNARFYTIALVFLLFEVELVFLFPWATVFGDKNLIAAAPGWGWQSLIEMTLFLGILLLGLVYIWVKGDLNWIKPEALIPQMSSSVPSDLYTAINQQEYPLKKFILKEEAQPAPVAAAPSSGSPAAPAKPMFRPGMIQKPASDGKAG